MTEGAQGGSERHAPPQEPAAAPPARPGTAAVPVCDLCGYPIRELHCKLICDQCGYTRDCSDP